MKRLSVLLCIVALIGTGFAMPGCSKNHKSGRSSGVPATGATGTGNTGTGSATGTGNAGDAVGIDLSWGTKFEASQAWLEAKAEVIKGDFAQGVWVSTEGQMYLRNQTLRNGRDENTRIRFDNPDGMYTSKGDAGVCSPYPPPYKILLPGGVPSDIFLHEFCHGQFVKHVEEYNCSPCIMGAYNISRKTQKWHYCGSDDCKSKSFCWDDYMLKKYPDWTHTGRDPGPAPACVVTIQ